MTNPVVRAVVAGVGLVLVIVVVFGSAYIAPEPDKRMELGFAALDVDAAFGLDHQFRGDVQIDVSMNAEPWKPWQAVKNLTCSQPVTITAVFSGSPGTWKRLDKDPSNLWNKTAPGDSRIGVGVSQPKQDVLVRAAEGDLGPIVPATEAHTRRRTVANAKLWLRDRPLTLAGDLRHSQTLIGGVMRRWPDSRAPVVVRFEAPWTSFRSFGSCYVQVPQLLRTSAALAAAEAQEGPDESGSAGPHLSEVTDGLTRFDTNGVLQDDESQPPPTAAGAVEGFRDRHDATWSCHAGDYDLGFGEQGVLTSPGSSARIISPKGRPALDSSGRAFVPPTRAFRSLESSRSCVALAVVSAPQAAWLQVVLLLVAGAAFVPLLQMLWRSGVRRRGNAPE